jgi:GDPmannose 4,6-dehydratase
LADPAKAREKLGWEPKVTFRELAKIMTDADMEAVGLKPVGEGKAILEKKFSGWHQWQANMSMGNERSGQETG